MNDPELINKASKYLDDLEYTGSKVVEYTEQDGFTPEQLEIITDILREKIPKNMLKGLISPKTHVDKLKMLYYYFRRRIPYDKIQKYFSEEYEYDISILSEIYLSYINNIPESAINLYARYDYSSSLIESIRKCLFEKNNSKVVIDYLLYNDYSEYEMYRRLKWIMRGLKPEIVNAFMGDNIHPHKTECMLTAIWNNYPKESLKLLAKTHIDSLVAIMGAIESNVPTDRLKQYVDKKYNPKLIEIIVEALKYKLEDNVIQNFIDIYNKTNNDKKVLKEFKSYVENNNIKEKLVEGVNDIHSYSRSSYETILMFIFNGVSIDKVNKYINPKMSTDEIGTILYFLYKSTSDEIMDIILSEEMKDISKRLFILALEEFKLSTEDIKTIFTPKYTQLQIKTLCSIFATKPPQWVKDMILDPNMTHNQMELMFRTYCSNIPEEKIKEHILDYKYNDAKIIMLTEILKLNLFDNKPTEFIKSLPNLSYEQTQEVILGIQNKLTETQICSYAKEDIDDITMRKIRIAYMWDFPQKEIDKLLNK